MLATTFGWGVKPTLRSGANTWLFPYVPLGLRSRVPVVRVPRSEYIWNSRGPSGGSHSNGAKNVDPLEGVVFIPHTREESALLRR